MPVPGEETPEAVVAETVVADVVEDVVADAPVVPELVVEDAELEARLSAEEDMERRAVHEHHEAPHFKKESD
jgi:hypothetical protein